jgi:undecaprenyl pyrophosphate phosphatase UppP
MGIIWVGCLFCFTYVEFLFNFISKNGVSFDEKIIELHKSYTMLVSNIGLVCILYVENFIECLVTKNNKNNKNFIYIIIDIIIAVFLMVLVQKKIQEEIEFVEWFHLYYLFIAFFVFLIIYKSESLKTTHLSSKNDIQEI